MPFDPSKFINPGQFADYSSYSGMGGDQQMKSIKQVVAESAGIPAAGGVTPPQAPMVPPQTFGEMATQQFNQAVAPIQQKFNSAVQSVNAYRGYVPQPNVINQHYGVE